MSEAGEQAIGEVVSEVGETTRVRGGWGVALAMAVFYTAGMAVIMALATQSYSRVDLILDEAWWQVGILAALTVAIAAWTRLRVQRSWRMSWFSMLLVIPVLAAIGGFAIAAQSSGTNWPLVAMVVLGTLFVGIGEETAFRGVVLNALAQRLTVFWAVVLSSVLFGLMHLSNLLSSTTSGTIAQVVFTTMVGLLFGWVYVSTRGNLILLIVLHWLYDAAVVGSLATGQGANPFGAVPSLIVAALGVLATVVMGIIYRGRRLSEVAEP